MNQPIISSVLPGGGIPLTLDKPRTLRLDFNAFCALGKATGQNPFKADFWSDFDDPSKLRATLWAALMHEDKSLSVEAVGGLIELGRMGEIASAVASAVSAAMPDKKSSAD